MAVRNVTSALLGWMTEVNNAFGFMLNLPNEKRLSSVPKPSCFKQEESSSGVVAINEP